MIMRFPRTPQLDNTDIVALRAEILAYFHATFSRYEQLFEILTSDEAYYHAPISLRHPLIFYFGHTATFFVNKLIVAGLLAERINPSFESMFSVGVDEMSWDDLDNTHYDWPSVSALRAYRDQVRTVVDRLINALPLTSPITWEHPWWTIVMAIEHERIHLETSSVLIRQQKLEWVGPHSAWQACTISRAVPVDTRVNVSGSSVQMGKSHQEATYGWDNEYGKQTVEVAAFQAGKYLVCNAQFLKFVEAGAYTDVRYWGAEAWAWRTYTNAIHPEFWVKNDTTWQLRLLTECIDMPWDWPVEVNYHEAQAWCSWQAAMTGEAIRLPTEAEWLRMVEVSGVTELQADDPASGNLHLDYWASSCPVTQFQHGELYDVVGNVWQWSATPIAPYPGFTVHPHYDDFTVPTFDGQHNLMKGGSWISTGNEARLAARYAFRRHFFQHAGFRYVIGEPLAVLPEVYYESDKQLTEYAEFHYGASYFDVANFPKALSDLALQTMRGKPMRRALDLGCAVGRATFELAREFDEVIGVDFSARFIQMGVQLAQTGQVRYRMTEEGDLNTYVCRELAGMGLDAIRHKVQFYQGDACNLKDSLSGFDLIVAANLIDRLYNPALFLQQVHTHLNLGGVLMITSPYTWLEEHTPRSAWLGGFKRDGETVTGLDGLKMLLGEHFQLIGMPIDVPFVIRETKRKFQHSVSEASFWERIK